MASIQPNIRPVTSVGNAHQILEGIPNAETVVGVLVNGGSFETGAFQGGQVLCIDPDDLIAVGKNAGDSELEIANPEAKVGIASRIASSGSPNEVARESGQINMVLSQAKTWNAFRGVVLPFLHGLLGLGIRAYSKGVRPMIECIMPDTGKEIGTQGILTILTKPVYVWVSVGKDAAEKFWIRLNISGSYRKVNADESITQVATPAVLLPGEAGIIYFWRDAEKNYISRIPAEYIRKNFGMIRASLRNGIAMLSEDQVEIRMNVGEITVHLVELNDDIYVRGFSGVHMDPQKGAYVVATMEQYGNTYATRIYAADVERDKVQSRAVADGKGTYVAQITASNGNRLSLFLGTTVNEGTGTTQHLRISAETPEVLRRR